MAEVPNSSGLWTQGFKSLILRRARCSLNGVVLVMLILKVFQIALCLSHRKRLNFTTEAYLPLNPGQAGSGYNSSDAWDYFHINSVDKDSEGSYLISARDANAIYKINGTTGNLIWRLGGKHSDFTLGEQVEFSFQHHARYLSRDGQKEVISLYDNSAHGTENGGGHEVHLYPYSRGKIVEVNTKSWEAKIVQAFHPPDSLLSKSQGSTQVLPRGNVLVNWGSSGALTEFLPNGTAIFHTYFDSGALGVGVENYRGFRFNWTGLPYEAPAIVSLKNETSTSVYVSWNGDTETKTWSFYGSTRGGKVTFLGEKKRTSFETVFVVHDELEIVKAEAVGKHGRVLASTDVVKSEPEVQQFQAEVENKEEQEGDGCWERFLRMGWGYLRNQEL
jgi:Arylsulfotransferase (ASST)